VCVCVCVCMHASLVQSSGHQPTNQKVAGLIPSVAILMLLLFPFP